MVPGFTLVDFLLHVESLSLCHIDFHFLSLSIFQPFFCVHLCFICSFALVFILSVCVLPLFFIGSSVFVSCLLRLLSSFASFLVLVRPLCYRFVICGFWFLSSFLFLLGFSILLFVVYLFGCWIVGYQLIIKLTFCCSACLPACLCVCVWVLSWWTVTWDRDILMTKYYTNNFI